MAGGFSVPGLQIHRVLKGASDRYRELQDEDWKIEKERRDQYVEQLSALIPTARTGADIEAINNEIAAVIAAPREKPYKPKLLKTPSVQAPQTQGRAAQGGKSGSGSGSGGATPPPFDFAQLSRLLTGAPEPTGMPDVPQSQGGPPDSISALPTGAIPPTGPQPAQMVPPVGAGSLGATGAPTPPVPGLTPPALPLGMTGGLPQQVATPPGRNVPEPSPLVGTLPGTPSPTPAGAGPQAAPTPPPIAAAQPTPPSPFMGYIERARLPYQLNAEFGVTKTGRPLNPNAKPLVTIKDMISAAKADRTIVPDPDSPTGFAVIPIEEENLTPAEKLKLDLDRSKLELNQIRGESIRHRDKLADLNSSLQRERLDLARQKNAVAMSHWVADTTIRVAKNYEASVKYFEEAKRNVVKIIADLEQATGPADYMAIVTTVHSIDQTAAREGEVETYRGAASITDRLKQILGRATEGDLLNGTTRAQMQAAVVAGVEALQPFREEIDARYGYTADQFGLDRRMVGVPGSSAATPPPVVGATPSSPKPKPTTSTKPSVERWERDPRTGKLRKAS